MAPVPHRWARHGLLTELERPAQVFANLTPNWYSSVMGTGIVAVAAASLPEQVRGLRPAATAIWVVAAGLLIALTAATAVHWFRHPRTARGHIRNPVMAHFYGAPPMAMMTVGAGSILLGRDVVGLRAAVDIDWVLWGAGSLAGLVVAASVPYLVFTRNPAAVAFGGWLMPVVPPLVSASTGTLLIPHAVGQLRLILLLSCYAMFALSLTASAIVIALIVARLVRCGPGEARMVPTLWIVLGPLGQSVTAANLLAGVAPDVLPAPYAHALRVGAVVYGVPIWGFALVWAGIAATITVRTARTGLPFSLTWWSFTFPVGTCVTGASALALHTGSHLFREAAVLGYAALVTAWVIVAVRTLRASLRGSVF